MGFNIIVQLLGTLDVKDHRCTWVAFKNIAGQQQREFVTPNNVAIVIDDTDTIGVTIESESQVESLANHLSLQVNYRVFNCGVRMVVREVAIDLRVHLDDLATHMAIDFRSDGTSHPIARIDRDAQWPL